MVRKLKLVVSDLLKLFQPISCHVEFVESSILPILVFAMQNIPHLVQLSYLANEESKESTRVNNLSMIPEQFRERFLISCFPCYEKQNSTVVKKLSKGLDLNPNPAIYWLCALGKSSIFIIKWGEVSTS